MATIINGDGIVTAEGTSTTQGRLRLGEDTDNGTNYVELQAPASVASNVTFTLPSADGTNGQVLQTNGSGALSFATPASGFSTMQIFTSSGTFTIPAGKTTVKATVVGGGGGGGGASASTNFAGNAGGNSSISSGTQTITTVTANGGNGGAAGTAGTSISGVAGGAASNGDINVQGGGGNSVVSSVSTQGGASLLGFGGNSGANGAGSAGNLYGGGGGAGQLGGSNLTGGGGGGTAIKYLTSLTPGNTITVTVGTGGTANPSGTTWIGGNGAAGVVIFEY